MATVIATVIALVIAMVIATVMATVIAMVIATVMATVIAMVIATVMATVIAMVIATVMATVMVSRCVLVLFVFCPSKPCRSLLTHLIIYFLHLTFFSRLFRHTLLSHLLFSSVSPHSSFSRLSTILRNNKRINTYK
ncbi:hypothetical protein CLU79DRAFT_772454 [Phycomyces nitens]|nr:hypothetical protein CLU79DRAFT_772454 [Phycomyces nitens]